MPDSTVLAETTASAGGPSAPAPPATASRRCGTCWSSSSRWHSSSSRSTSWKLCRQHKQVDYSKELRQLRTNYTSLLRKTYDNLSAWETVQVARHPQRPLFKDYVEMICREFRELHGDRHFGDDPAIKCGLARLGGHKVMLIGHHKGRDTKEKVRATSASPTPRGTARRCAA